MKHKRSDTDLENMSPYAPLYALVILGTFGVFIGGIVWLIVQALP